MFDGRRGGCCGAKHAWRDTRRATRSSEEGTAQAPAPAHPALPPSKHLAAHRLHVLLGHPDEHKAARHQAPHGQPRQPLQAGSGR